MAEPGGRRCEILIVGHDDTVLGHCESAAEFVVRKYPDWPHWPKSRGRVPVLVCARHLTVPFETGEGHIARKLAPEAPS